MTGTQNEKSTRSDTGNLPTTGGSSGNWQRAVGRNKWTHSSSNTANSMKVVQVRTFSYDSTTRIITGPTFEPFCNKTTFCNNEPNFQNTTCSENIIELKINESNFESKLNCTISSTNSIFNISTNSNIDSTPKNALLNNEQNDESKLNLTISSSNSIFNNSTNSSFNISTDSKLNLTSPKYTIIEPIFDSSIDSLVYHSSSSDIDDDVEIIDEFYMNIRESNMYSMQVDQSSTAPKRRMEADKGEKQPAGKKKKDGPTFAQMCKMSIMLEIRTSDPAFQLKQGDYNLLDNQLGYLYADKVAEGETLKIIYKTLDTGLSQGAMWIACANQDTADFIIEWCPTITPPDDRQFMYTVYGPHRRPFKDVKLRLAERFWNDSSRLMFLITSLNDELDFVYTTRGEGELVEKAGHIRISAGMDNKKTDIENGYFIITLEVCDKVMDVLVRNYKGLLQIGCNPVQVYGGGIEKMIQDFNEETRDVVAEDIIPPSD